MGKYLIKRILRGIVSIILVVAIVMILVYSLMDRVQVFAVDSAFSRQALNARDEYMYNKWEQYGYVDYVPYADWLNELARNGEIDEETRSEAVNFGRTAESDSDVVAEYVQKFTEYYESQGYNVIRLDAKMNGRKVMNGGQQKLFASKDLPLTGRILKYFTSLVQIDSVNYAPEVEGERGLTFTWYDPAYGGEKFSPAIIGNGTRHKYLFFVDDTFPYIHQNLATISLGVSYSVTKDIDVFTTMTRSQGSYVKRMITYPTGHMEESADDLHTATYSQGTRTATPLNEDRFTDDYTIVDTTKNNMSKMGFSFVIGIISTVASYCLALPMGLLMALKKDKLVDHIGNVYIIFISAVPSLAYIFMVKGIGGALGAPTNFDMESGSKMMFLLPIISLSLSSIASLMKWTRRYVVDQHNSDYVKFARSGGLTEGEIFSNHILKNAIIPITHGIPGSLLFAMTGALITEKVYVVPGTGGLLNEAITKFDNSVIIGIVLFYAILSVAASILGDVLMSMVDPRISFTTKDR